MRVSFGLLSSAALCSPAHSIKLGEACLADDNRTKVVCLGASITRGNVRIFSGIASTKPYPQQLWELLGSRYCVQNLGVPGATVLKHSHQPYWDATQTLAQAQDINPDIVILQFGANDSKERNMHKDFQPDYVSLIRLFQGLESRPAVYVLAVPPIYKCTPKGRFVYGMDADIVNSLTEPLQHIAQASHIPPPISVFNSFVRHCPDLKSRCSWMAPDGVHPNTIGDGIMASLIYYTIKGNDRCSVDAHQRVECAAVTKSQCKQQGCCYEPSATPRCFRRAELEPPTTEECTAADEEKTDCGFPSFTAEDCHALGCCWKASEFTGTPFCYHKVVRWSPPSTTMRTSTTSRSTTSTSCSTTSTSRSTTTTSRSTTTTSRSTTSTSRSTTTASRSTTTTIRSATIIHSSGPTSTITQTTTSTVTLPSTTTAWLAVPLTWTTTSTTTTEQQLPFVMLFDSLGPWPVGAAGVAALAAVLASCTCMCISRRSRELKVPDQHPVRCDTPPVQLEESSPVPGRRSGNWRRARPVPWLDEDDEAARLLQSSPEVSITEDLPSPCSAAPEPLHMEPVVPLPTPPRPAMPLADPTLMLTPQLRVAKEEPPHAEPSTADASDSVAGAGPLSSESSESSQEAEETEETEEASMPDLPLHVEQPGSDRTGP